MRVVRFLRMLLRLLSILLAAGVVYITLYSLSGEILEESNQVFWTKTVIFDLSVAAVGVCLDRLYRIAAERVPDDTLCEVYSEIFERDCMTVSRWKAFMLLAVIINSGMLAYLLPRGNAQFLGEWESIAGYLSLLVSAASLFLMYRRGKTLQAISDRLF